jgi:hypothetical protein
MKEPSEEIASDAMEEVWLVQGCPIWVPFDESQNLIVVSCDAETSCWPSGDYTTF